MSESYISLDEQEWINLIVKSFFTKVRRINKPHYYRVHCNTVDGHKEVDYYHIDYNKREGLKTLIDMFDQKIPGFKNKFGLMLYYQDNIKKNDTYIENYVPYRIEDTRIKDKNTGGVCTFDIDINKIELSDDTTTNTPGNNWEFFDLCYL